MPYNIVPFESGYKLQLKNDTKHVFTKKPMKFEDVLKQLRAIEMKKHKNNNENVKYKLHAVILKKPINFNDAKYISQKFIKDKNKKFYRETDDSFRFRNIPKTKFSEFRTKQINDNISLIYGKLKNNY